MFWALDWHPDKHQIVVGGSNDTFFKLISTDNYQESAYRSKRSDESGLTSNGKPGGSSG